MAGVAFDTLEAVKRLRAAGVEQAQAEAIASMGREAAQADREDLATKEDVYALKEDVHAIKEALATLEARLTWRMIGLAAFIIAAVKLIPAF